MQFYQVVGEYVVEVIKECFCLLMVFDGMKWCDKCLVMIVWYLVCGDGNKCKLLIGVMG